MVDYPNCLANILLVLKKDGKVQMYMNCGDLNKPNPEDDLPLPHINVLVDNIDGQACSPLRMGSQAISRSK